MNLGVYSSVSRVGATPALRLNSSTDLPPPSLMAGVSEVCALGAGAGDSALHGHALGGDETHGHEVDAHSAHTHRLPARRHCWGRSRN